MTRSLSLGASAARDRALRTIVLCLDGLMVLSSMGASRALHAGLRELAPVQAHLQLRVPPSFEQYALLSYLTLPLFIGLVVFFGMHRWFERAFSRTQLFLGLLKVHFAVLAGLALILFVTQSVINRSLLGFFLLSTFVLQFAARDALSRWQRFQHATGQARTRLLLVGTASADSQRDIQTDIQNFVDTAAREPFPPEIAGILTSTAELERVLHEQPVDHVLFFSPEGGAQTLAGPLALCETLGIPAGIAIDMTPTASVQPRIELLCGHAFVDFDASPKPPASLALKHAFDVVAAACGLMLVAPLLLVVSLLILISMGRPVFFAQARAGRRGRTFRMLKFRTMVNDAERLQESLRAHNEMSGPVFKIRADPRVTPLGRLLRVTSIDELPQLFNVLLGQMSLVGPRPLPHREQEQIRGWHRRRLSMKPGITGLWQVSGRNDVGFDEWMRMDLEYVDRWSPTHDLVILLRTLPALLRRRGAC